MRNQSALVVDDEKPARRRVTDLLRRVEWIGAVREAGSGTEAVAAIGQDRPDLVFLDIQMPELDGFGVVRAVGPEQMPATVFVTAYDRYAIHAFEAQALDYLLKPFSDERFEKALDRARALLESREWSDLGRRLVNLVGPPERTYLDRLAIKRAGRVEFLRTCEIDWVEAQGVYVNLHLGGKTILYRATLGELEAQLDPARFLRVHRSALINLDRVNVLEPHSHGDYIIVLADRSRIKLSRTFRSAFESRLGQKL